MRRILIAAVSLVLALQAQQALPTGTVKGVVTSAGKPVAAAKVVLSSSTDSGYTASAATDVDGAFAIGQVPVGTVEVRVFSSDGALAISGKGELKTAGEVLSLPIQIP
jgi:hypothetical protein